MEVFDMLCQIIGPVKLPVAHAALVLVDQELGQVIIPITPHELLLLQV
jgi:hypothetical protein